jgi:hypothetical protein
MLPRLIIGILLCLTGIIWIGQGVGAIGGSFMTGQVVWAVIGAVALFLGAALLVGARRRTRGG